MMNVTLIQNTSIEDHTYTFFIEGVSHVLLQELEPHKMESTSFQTTKYPLEELAKEDSFSSMDTLRASKYLVSTENSIVNEMSIKALENLRIVLQTNIENNIAKYCLPESYKTSLTWSIKTKSLQNFIALRSSKSALWEIRKLAQALFMALPTDHRYLFKDCVDNKDIEGN